MSDIVDRLGDHHEHPVTGKLVLKNPDGPEAADTIAALRAENEASWQREQRLAKNVAESKGEVERLREALEAVAKSLEAIGNKAGRDVYLDGFLQIRGYAQDRAKIARAALAEKGE